MFGFGLSEILSTYPGRENVCFGAAGSEVAGGFLRVGVVEAHELMEEFFFEFAGWVFWLIYGSPVAQVVGVEG